jgi:hypothetical protein
LYLALVVLAGAAVSAEPGKVRSTIQVGPMILNARSRRLKICKSEPP